jgi:predicted HicB family RNase H-like nuclease
MTTHIPTPNVTKTFNDSNTITTTTSSINRLPTHDENHKDERIAILQSKLNQLNIIIAGQNKEIKHLREQNKALLKSALEADGERESARVKTKKYKTVAIRMKDKIHRLQNKLTSEQVSTNEQMSFVVDQTKSLLERLFVADARRRDLEGRFGSLARPSTKLRVEIDRSWHQQYEDDDNLEDEEEDAQENEIHGLDRKKKKKKKKRTEEKKRKNFLHGNVPPSIVVAPQNLLDRSFTPMEPEYPHHNVKPSPRQNKMRSNITNSSNNVTTSCRVVNVPQKFVIEKEVQSMLSREEKMLLSQLSSHVSKEY